MLRFGSKLLLPVVSASLMIQMSAMNMNGAMMVRAAVACQLRRATRTATEARERELGHWEMCLQDVTASSAIA